MTDVPFGARSPGFWAHLLLYASAAIQQGRKSDARFYIRMSRDEYPKPRLP
jgi:hypothetical protein